ncbi:MAG: hypothetical protein ACTSXX_08375 [Candidatus Baldrarchaeia archaeon]
MSNDYTLPVGAKLQDKNSIKTLVKAILVIFYNTNTLIVNPSIYLKFLLPFLLMIFLKLSFRQLFLLALVYTISLYIYNLVYIMNDYFDLKEDLKTGRKKSIVHLFKMRFEIPIIITVSSIILLSILLFFLTRNLFLLQVLGISVLIAICLSVLHSKVFNTKWITLLLLRLFRVALPLFLLSLIIPVFQNLLLFVIMLFPLYNLKGYIGYLKLKKLMSIKNKVLGIIISSLISLSGLYLIIREGVVISFCYYLLIFSALIYISKVFGKYLLRIIYENKYVRYIMRLLRYNNPDEKLEELLQFCFYLIIVIFIITFHVFIKT